MNMIDSRKLRRGMRAENRAQCSSPRSGEIFPNHPQLQGQGSFFRCSREHRSGDDMRPPSHAFSSYGCK
ncbi:hypothetical protein C7U60_02415 [Mesorhizobium plurifarium]|nr:hypothetical protein C7U60_02415 [Mesorhizobium plurifarium]